MNIIDVIDSNHFLKQLYPNGLDDFFVGSIELDSDGFGHMTLMLHTRTRPSIEVSKWGKWGFDYNVIVIEITSDLIKKTNILNWKNGFEKKCDCEIFELENYIHVNLGGKDWSVNLIVGDLLFQRGYTYLSDETGDPVISHSAKSHLNVKEINDGEKSVNTDIIHRDCNIIIIPKSNIIDAIDNNHFLKQLYPNGLNDFILGQIELNGDGFGNVTLGLHTRIPPSIEVYKWGEWGINYNRIVIKITSKLIEKVNILNWENAVGKECDCDCEVIKIEDRIHLNLGGGDWSVNLIVGSLTFQQGITYLMDDEEDQVDSSTTLR